MAKNLLYIVLATLLLAACQVIGSAPTDIPVIEPSRTSVPTETQVAVTATPLKPTITPSLSTVAATPTASTTPTPTSVPTPIVQPVINEGVGDIYETVFSIPVGDDSIIQYIETCCADINGPNAIAVLPDDSFMIADFTANRLLQYDQLGILLNTIELEDLGISTVKDMRLKGEELFLLEISYQNYYVHQLSLESALITNHKIPHHFPIEGDDFTLENGLTGIAIDCEGNIILEVAGGAILLHLADVQTQSDPANVNMNYFCNDKRYRRIITSYGPKETPKLITDGDVIYETHLTTGVGSFTLLDAFKDGSFYVILSDRVDESPSKYDLTVHHIGPDGVEKGVARIPHSEFYYYIMRSAAIDSHGEVFVLLPRAESLDIVRLNFYEQLEPLIPGAVIPHVSSSSDKP